MRELTQFEPDTIITQLPLVIPPHTAPWALSRLLPRMLVLTNIGLEHIDLFVNKDRIAHEYLVLANSLHGDGLVVANADDEYLRELCEYMHRPVITYGVHPKADVRISRAARAKDATGLFLEIVVHGTHHELFLPHLFAKQHVSAVAAGIAAAHGMGVGMQDAIQGLHTMKPHRSALSHGVGASGVQIIDDSYNTCPEQLESSVKSFATLSCAGKKILVLGDMDLLATFGPEKHEAVAKQAVAIAQLTLFVGPMMRRGQDSALAAGTQNDTHHFVSSEEAAAWLVEHVQKDDLVFVSGGKSMDMGKVVKRLKAK